MNEDGTPFRIVLDSILDTSNVINIPSRTIPVRVSVEAIDRKASPSVPPIKMVPMAISVGKRPLQGTKLFVR